MEREGRGSGGELAKEQGLGDMISRAQVDKGWFRRKKKQKKKIFFFLRQDGRWKGLTVILNGS